MLRNFNFWSPVLVVVYLVALYAVLFGAVSVTLKIHDARAVRISTVPARETGNERTMIHGGVYVVTVEHDGHRFVCDTFRYRLLHHPSCQCYE